MRRHPVIMEGHAPCRYGGAVCGMSQCPRQQQIMNGRGATIVRHEVALDECGRRKAAIRRVSTPVPNPDVRHWQRWGAKLGITPKDIAYKLRFRAKCQVPTFPSLRVAKGA